MSPNVLYVGDPVLVWVEYQGWCPAVLTSVHPNLSAQREHIRFPEPVRRSNLKRVEA